MSQSGLDLAQRLLRPVTRAAEEATRRLQVTFDVDRTVEDVFGQDVLGSGETDAGDPGSVGGMPWPMTAAGSLPGGPTNAFPIAPPGSDPAVLRSVNGVVSGVVGGDQGAARSVSEAFPLTDAASAALPSPPGDPGFGRPDPASRATAPILPGLRQAVPWPGASSPALDPAAPTRPDRIPPIPAATSSRTSGATTAGSDEPLAGLLPISPDLLRAIAPGPPLDPAASPRPEDVPPAAAATPRQILPAAATDGGEPLAGQTPIRPDAPRALARPSAAATTGPQPIAAVTPPRMQGAAVMHSADPVAGLPPIRPDAAPILSRPTTAATLAPPLVAAATTARVTGAGAGTPGEPFPGLLPIRANPPQALADLPNPAASASPLVAPSVNVRPIAWRGASQVGRAMQPLFGRAADLTDAALDHAVPADASDNDGLDAAAPADATAAPVTQVSNTFNVSVALGDRAAPADREALRDALVAILRDGARRQGLDV